MQIIVSINSWIHVIIASIARAVKTAVTSSDFGGHSRISEYDATLCGYVMVEQGSQKIQ